ncbi:MAG: nicotinamidase [Chloroflexi bacterium]|nr:nicotinamidase [Chloroflexota bacterium]
MERDSALLVVDMQNCFLPGGSLAVAEGDEVIPVINRYIELFQGAGRPVFASRDWHPEETTHFEKWPQHCVQNTRSAEFHPDLALPPDATVVSKGMDPQEDAYSAFQAVDQEGRLLGDSLRARGIRHLYVSGLALDYCVRYSALDAARNGLQVTLLIDATRAVNAEIHDAETAIEDLVRSGVRLATIETVGAREASAD